MLVRHPVPFKQTFFFFPLFFFPPFTFTPDTKYQDTILIYYHLKTCLTERSRLKTLKLSKGHKVFQELSQLFVEKGFRSCSSLENLIGIEINFCWIFFSLSLSLAFSSQWVNQTIPIFRVPPLRKSLQIWYSSEILPLIPKTQPSIHIAVFEKSLALLPYYIKVKAESVATRVTFAESYISDNQPTTNAGTSLRKKGALEPKKKKATWSLYI